MPTLINITATRGDTWTIRFGPITEEGVPISMVGAKAWFTVKSIDAEDADVDALIQITEAVDAVKGQITLNTSDSTALALVKPAVTRLAPGTYAIDLQVKYGDAKIGTPAKGTIKVTRDVSHAIT
jgi:hypothetical protein